METMSYILFVVGVIVGFYISKFLNITLTDRAQKILDERSKK